MLLISSHIENILNWKNQESNAPGLNFSRDSIVCVFFQFKKILSDYLGFFSILEQYDHFIKYS